MNIQDFPIEILEKILTNLSPSNACACCREWKTKVRQLLDCTEVCKLFNEVIGQSERLMSGIAITWDESKDSFHPTTSRLYHDIRIKKVSTASTHLLNFLKTQPKIRYMHAGHGLKLQGCEFGMIVDSVKNSLQELDIHFVKLKGEPVLMPMSLPNLRELSIISTKGIEKTWYLFDNSEKIEDFHFDIHTTLSSDFFKKIETFLIGCKRLKNLWLFGTIMDNIFETSYFAERASFQLEEICFSWDEIVFDSQMSANLVIFMKNQIFLKELTFHNLLVTGTLLNAILAIKTLKIFELWNPKFQAVHNVYVKSTSIKTLDISNEVLDAEDDDIEWYTGVCNVIKGCPVVRKLRLNQVSFCEMVAEHVVEHQKILKTLEVYMDKKIHIVTVPSLRTLILDALSNEFSDDQVTFALGFVQHNPQLTKIKLHESLKERLEELANVAQGKLKYFS